MRNWWPDVKWYVLFTVPVIFAFGLGYYACEVTHNNADSAFQDNAYSCLDSLRETVTRLKQAERMNEMCIKTVESSAQEEAICLTKLQHCMGYK